MLLTGMAEPEHQDGDVTDDFEASRFYGNEVSILSGSKWKGTCWHRILLCSCVRKMCKWATGMAKIDYLGGGK